MMPNTRRPTILPRSTLPVAVGALLAVAAVVMILLLGGVEPVSVPAVSGLEAPVARSRLAQRGLLMDYGDTRFSSEVPAGGVVEQDPPAGAEVPPGSVVIVVVSAGADAFPMPDVLGSPLDQARAELMARGLAVEVEAAPSDAPPDTVIATAPSPGVEVATGSTVRLTVAGDIGPDSLLPGDMSGVVVLLDPAPPADGLADVAMEITRHLRALLEASGAEILVTRSIVETHAPAPVRAAWADEASATIVVGLSAAGRGGGARDVLTLPSSPEYADRYLASVDLARDVVSYLADAGETASLVLPVDDEVLSAAGVPGVRVMLGDPEDPLNVDDFSDPAWTDRVSKALYRALVNAIGPG